MKPTDFASALAAYLGEFLPAQRNVSPNTIKAYRDAFTLLLRYCRDERAPKPDRLTLDHIDVSLVVDFLKYLETARASSPGTRNHRLAVVHAFFRYLQTEDPGRMLKCQQILAIPRMRCARRSVDYLCVEDLAAILDQPDLSTSTGRRDAVLLSVLYDTGARVQELIDLSVRDVRLVTPAQVHLTGKGRKTRVIPLMKATVDLVREYTREHQMDRPERLESPLFSNRRGERLSRSGIREILLRHTETARRSRPGLPPRVSPHTLRHTKAMHLLQAGNPLTTVQAILGHADVRTSEIYARADLEMKRKALERAVTSGVAITPKSWQTDTSLMGWLRAL
jgi:site-specific recombinase XerD